MKQQTDIFIHLIINTLNKTNHKSMNNYSETCTPSTDKRNKNQLRAEMAVRL